MNRLHAYPSSIRRSVVATAVACCFGSSLALANPTGPAVVSGQASFASRGKQLTVTNTPGSIINWQAFSIGAGETTRFIQQSAASTVLNRVVGADPSAILGALQSNGRVILVNPNGIMFGASAAIDVAGLIASTLNISNADFLAGRMRFGATPGAGPIDNAGEIRTPAGGKVVLISPAGVENSGVIHSPKGEVILAAGKTVELADTHNPEVRVEISAPEAKAVNLGRIVAESGRVGIYGGIVANHGVVSADSAVVGENGRIVFRATRAANLEAGSVTSASGASGGTVEVDAGSAGTTLVAGEVRATGNTEAGGEVRLLGERVGLTGQGSVDASGERGGGTVLVGGDLQGANPEVRNAQMTYVGADARIQADAVGAGNGGKVIVWADDSARSHGAISARGGARGGDGGFVETSSKQRLEVTRGPDVRAPAGRAGTWLIDPVDIEIVAGNEFDETTNTGAPFFAPLTENSRIGVDLINAQLDFGSNVLITTTSRGPSAGAQAGNITVSAPIVKTARTMDDGPFIGSTNITLQAHNDIVITPTGSITSVGDPLSVTLTANSDGMGGGAVTVGGVITTLGGSVTISGAGTVAINAPINTLFSTGTSGNSVQLTSSAGQIAVAAPVNSGFFSASGSTGTTIAAPVAALSSFQTSSANGATTIASNVSATGSVTLSGRNGVRIAGGTQLSTGAFGSFSASVTDPNAGSALTLEAGSLVTANGATLTADNMDIQGVVSTGSGSITARQNLAGRAITLGTEVAGTLSLSQMELSNLVTTGSLFVGNSASGAMTFAGPIVATGPSSLNFASGTSITQNAGLSASGSLSYNAPSVTIAAPVSSAAVNSVTLTADNLDVNSTVTSGGNITVTGRTSSRAISLGVSAPTGAALELSAAEINNLIAPTRLMFNTFSGPITVVGPIAPTGASTLSLVAPNGTIGQSAGAIITVPSLALTGRTSINLPEANDVTNLAAQIQCCSTGSINFVSKPGKLVNIVNVDSVSGVSVNNFSGTSTVTLQADDFNIASQVRANIGNVVLKPTSAATPVTLGADAGGTLGLTNAELAQVQGTTLTIQADRMDIAAPVTFFPATTTLAPLTPDRPVSIVAGTAPVDKGTPGDLQFIPGEFANLAGGTIVIGGSNAGPIAVNTSVTVPGSVSNFVLHSGNTSSSITVAASANIAATNTMGLITDVLDLGAGLASSNGNINISTNTAARNITLGGDPGGTLGLGTAELGFISAPSGTLGFTTASGNIDINTNNVTFGGGSIGGLALDAGSTLTLDWSLTTPGTLSMRAPTIELNSNSTAAGTITLIGDAMMFDANLVSTAGDINVMPRTFRSIDLGGSTAGTLQLSDTFLNLIQPGTGVRRIGDLNFITNSINVSGAISLPMGSTLSLLTANNNVTQSAAISIPGGSLRVEADNLITLSQANNVDNVALRSSFNSVNFTRAPGGALNVTTVDGLSGVTADFGFSPVTLTADQVNINANVQGSTVTLAPHTAGTIDIGTKPGGGLFGFAQAEFDRIFASTGVTVGNLNSGATTVSQAVTIGTFNDLSLVTGSTLTVVPSADLTVPGNLTLTAGTTATSAPLTSSFGAVTLVTNSLTLGAMVTAGGGQVNVRTLTASNHIDLGGADVVSTTSTLGLNGTDLANIDTSGGTLALGSTAMTGDIMVTHEGTLPGSVALRTGGDVSFSAASFGVDSALTVQANTMQIPGGAVTAVDGVFVSTTTAGRNITLGADPGTPAGLDLLDTELAKINVGPTGWLSFDTSGTLTTATALAFTSVSNVRLAGSTIVHNVGTLSAPGAITLMGNDIPDTGFSAVQSTGGGRITVAPRTSRNMTIGTVVGGTLSLLPTQIAALSTTGSVQLGDTTTANSINVTAPLMQPAGSSALVLAANSSISQTAGSGITASALRLTSNFGTFTLTDNANSIGTVAGNTFGNFSLTSTGTLTVGTVDGVSGISDSTVTLRADAINVDQIISGGTVTLAPRTAGAAVDLGTKSGGFAITDAEIDRISASTINIGTNGTNPTGAINVTAPVSTGFVNLGLLTGTSGAINVGAALSSSSAIQMVGSGLTVNAPITSEFSQVSFTPGTGAIGSFANLNAAVSARNSVSITADTINVNAPLTGTASFSSVNLGAFSNTASSAVTVNQQITAGSSIGITTNSLAISAPLVTTGSSVTLAPKTAIPVSLGMETPGAFSINTAELALITADQLTVGSSGAGPLTVNAPIGPFTYDSLVLRSGGDVTQTPGSTITVRNVDPLDPLNVTGSLSVFSGGRILLPEANDIAVSVSGSASGSGTNFEFNNIGPLKLQNVSGVFATGKVLLNAPPGFLILGGDGSSTDISALNSILSAILEAQDTQKDADEDAEERKSDDKKKEEEEQKKKGTQACS